MKGKSIRFDESDNEYFDDEFLKKIAKRGSEIISVTGKSSAPSCAAAICDHMRDWWYGTDLTSMAIIASTNPYGIDGDLCFSYPVSINNQGHWSIVEGLEINDF
jgi:malate/lactate dehydrogenase